MKPFDIFIAYVSWGGNGKKRPVLVFTTENERVLVYPITSQYDQKSDKVKANYFEVSEWKQAGLNKKSYVDTGNLYRFKSSVFSEVNPIGRLSETDKQNLLRHLQNNN